MTEEKETIEIPVDEYERLKKAMDGMYNEVVRLREENSQLKNNKKRQSISEELKKYEDILSMGKP